MIKKSYLLSLILALSIVFFLVYSPHFQNRFPLHVDEWHHIEESIKFQEGNYHWSTFSFRIGFQLFLFLIPNLILVYQLLPALWAVLSALVLFYVAYKKSGNFWVGLFSVLFFSSIKSNVNIMGLWFFTPLTFSIPFIFAFMYFYSEGLEKKSKKFVLLSFLFMVILIPIHVISLSFAIPILLVYSFMHWRYILKEWKFFIIFLLIPLFILIFYNFVMSFPLKELFSKIISELVFEKGWGVIELNNSFLEGYSFVGYFFAIVGVIYLSFYKKQHWAYILWPIYLLLSIFYFRLSGLSYFSPYQRNFYYFVISLPFLSAFGLKCFIEIIKDYLPPFKKLKFLNKRNLILGFIIFLSILPIYFNYYEIPRGLEVYYPLNDDINSALNFLKEYPKGVVMIPATNALAVYSISGHTPFTTLFFYGLENRKAEIAFYQSDCFIKNAILDYFDIQYVFEDYDVGCGWEPIYNESVWIYRVNHGDY